ncbi:TetR/AcrR family transcriptional regulator [Actinoallomurus iriomotensis]|uniref:TetR family transcriptional regulator n=1 Tax=Actinoallomurus iriomotensis TaxID=478107 RepID=A0A9W6VV27_9ACTN|nr:TetR/AcrR family transcriptional regulator [Actinoallomurus iriomotensis]GLY81365.1 TetR family transcriptional regulator [Actinoallomurus iriomotensis]
MGDAVKSPRARYREQVRDEIKAHAWTQVATTGASALSLNAIAKQMGISGPALYRYFRNRDELITELVLDAYRDLYDTWRAAVTPGDSPEARLAAMASALRRWALATPHRYLLIYGTPVPGYAAPPEATELAAGLMALLLDAFAETEGKAENEAATALEHHLATHRQWAADHPAPPSALRRALTFWTRLHGVVSLEVAGHFTGMNFDPGLLYAAEGDSVVNAP